MSESQWNIKVKIVTLDRGDVQATKNRWEVGDCVTVQIEPHATINMVKQRIAILVAAHMKHQTLTTEAGEELGDVVKLQDCIADGGLLLLNVQQPKEEEAPPVVLSDDEDLWPVGEAEDAEPLPPADGPDLSDEAVDKQNALKQESAEKLEDGDKAGALAKLTEAMMVGKPTAMMICKRGELLLKLKRPNAAAIDATAALAINPDSGKAFKIRGKARRYMGDYQGALDDLNQAQKIDYDDGVADVHSYVKGRVAKLTLKAKQDAAKAAAAEAS